MLEIKYGKLTLRLNEPTSMDALREVISKELHCGDFYLLSNGKLLQDVPQSENGIVHVVPKLVGGKGGFGSMLRAIGAQIEKTTNREACRDLSGRRLRDINEEKRLKAWIDKQAMREQEAEDKKQKKLERLVRTPKHEFKNEAYDKERSELPERVEDAVTQGMEAAASSSAISGNKRKVDATTDAVKKKKMRGALWLDDVELSSDDHSEEDSDSEAVKSA